MWIETLISLIVAIVGGVGGMYLWERKLRDRIVVKRLLNTSDECVPGLIELYTKLFPDDGTNYTAEELLDLTEGKDDNRHIRSVDIRLIALYHQDVVGFIFCHFYQDRRKAIISYFGIDKDVLEARRSAANKLLHKLMKILSIKNNLCDYLFFDLQNPDPSLTQKENSERKARPILFRQIARLLGLRAYRFDFEYECPRISLSKGTHEEPLILMCIPLKENIISPIPKGQLIEFLNFIYLDCYGDLYPISDERFYWYHEHLKDKLKRYESKLPSWIEVS